MYEKTKETQLIVEATRNLITLKDLTKLDHSLEMWLLWKVSTLLFMLELIYIVIPISNMVCLSLTTFSFYARLDATEEGGQRPIVSLDLSSPPLKFFS